MPSTQNIKNTSPDDAITVIELFQSQGCSSCPPTNTNVLQLLDNPNLLVLVYHVTYWDRLGWRDTFGKPTHDQKQWEYARALQRTTVYTPQVIVNGQVEGVGNSSKDLKTLIATGNAFSATRTVKISYLRSISMVRVSGPETGQGLVTAIDYTVKSADVPILHGENGGRTLTHSNIVRDVAVIGAWGGGSQDFVLPEIPNEAGLRRAILVSAGQGGPIHGACLI